MEGLLREAQVVVHPLVVGELALGRLKKRGEILGLLAEMPRAEPVSHDEVLAFVERRGISGAGIGWVDAHLLASAALGRSELWTLDRRLAHAAGRLGLAVG